LLSKLELSARTSSPDTRQAYPIDVWFLEQHPGILHLQIIPRWPGRHAGLGPTTSNAVHLKTSARAYQPFVKTFKLCSLQKEARTRARINHFVAIRVIRGPRSFMIDLFCGRLHVNT
jgi:hypothetical protein